jgi:hypothetical protein
MEVSVLERFRQNGYEAIVRDANALAVAVVSDFVCCFQEDLREDLRHMAQDEQSRVTEFLWHVELLRDAIAVDAILTPGQQKLLQHRLHYASENTGLQDPSGLDTYADIMSVVDWIHNCSRCNGV